MGAVPGVKVIDVYRREERGRTRRRLPDRSGLSEEEKKIRAERLLRGLGASRIYAASIPNYPYLEGIVEKRNYPHAKNLARHSLSLSTNTFLTARDMASIVEIIKKVTTS